MNRLEAERWAKRIQREYLEPCEVGRRQDGEYMVLLEYGEVLVTESEAMMLCEQWDESRKHKAERSIPLRPDQAQRWIVQSLPSVEGLILHTGMFGGWINGVLTIALIAPGASRRDVGQVRIELVPESQSLSVATAYACGPQGERVARAIREVWAEADAEYEQGLEVDRMIVGNAR